MAALEEAVQAAALEEAASADIAEAAEALAGDLVRVVLVARITIHPIITILTDTSGARDGAGVGDRDDITAPADAQAV